MRKQQGFSLIEMVIAASIAGLLIAIVTPGFLNIRSSLLRSQVRWGLLGDLRYARQLAVTKHKSVVVKFGDGSTTTNVTSYQLFTDTNGNGSLDAGEQALNRTLPSGAYLTTVSLTPTDQVIYDTSGSLTPACTGGTITFRGPKGGSDTLLVSAIGMVYHP